MTRSLKKKRQRSSRLKRALRLERCEDRRMLAGPDEAIQFSPVMTVDLRVTDDLASLIFAASSEAASSSSTSGPDLAGTELNSNFDFSLTGRNYLTVSPNAYYSNVDSSLGDAMLDQAQFDRASQRLHSTLVLSSGLTIPAVVILPEITESLADSTSVSQPYHLRIAAVQYGSESSGVSNGNLSSDSFVIGVENDSVFEQLDWSEPKPLPRTPKISTIDVPAPFGPIPAVFPKSGTLPQNESVAGLFDEGHIAQRNDSSSEFDQGEGGPVMLATSSQSMSNGDFRKLRMVPWMPSTDSIQRGSTEASLAFQNKSLASSADAASQPNENLPDGTKDSTHHPLDRGTTTVIAGNPTVPETRSQRVSFATHQVVIQHAEVSLAFEYSTDGAASGMMEAQSPADEEGRMSRASKIDPAVESLSMAPSEDGSDVARFGFYAHQAARLAGTPTVLLVVGTLWARTRGKENPRPRLKQKRTRK